MPDAIVCDVTCEIDFPESVQGRKTLQICIDGLAVYDQVLSPDEVRFNTRP
jgi:hypothetical protein